MLEHCSWYCTRYTGTGSRKIYQLSCDQWTLLEWSSSVLVLLKNKRRRLLKRDLKCFGRILADTVIFNKKSVVSSAIPPTMIDNATMSKDSVSTVHPRLIHLDRIIPV